MLAPAMTSATASLRKECGMRWRNHSVPLQAAQGGMRSAGRAQEADGVARDHQVLVGRHHPRRGRRALRRETRASALVRLLVQLDPEPARVAADALPDRARVLADAAGEDERVEASEGRGHRAELAADAV